MKKVLLFGIALCAILFTVSLPSCNPPVPPPCPTVTVDSIITVDNTHIVYLSNGVVVEITDPPTNKMAAYVFPKIDSTKPAPDINQLNIAQTTVGSRITMVITDGDTGAFNVRFDTTRLYGLNYAGTFTNYPAFTAAGMNKTSSQSVMNSTSWCQVHNFTMQIINGHYCQYVDWNSTVLRGKTYVVSYQKGNSPFSATKILTIN